MAKSNKQRESQPHRSNGGRKITVAFSLQQPEAREVYLCGDFNAWSPGAVPMERRQNDGAWEKRLMLSPGRYEYQFVVDGKWTPDPKSQANVMNPFGSINSVVEI